MAIHSDTNTKSSSLEQGGTFAVLRVPSYAWFLTGTTISNAAFWIQSVTINWLVYDLTSSGAMLGTLSLVSSIAAVGLAPFAGMAIDRLSRRRMLFATSAWLFSISLIFGLVLLGNPSVVWPLFLFSFLNGVGQAVSTPLRQTVVFSVAPRAMIPSAVALVQTGWAIMRSIGPAIGGFLILWIGPAGNFFVQAGAFALVFLTIFKLQMPYERQEDLKTVSAGSFREGWHFIASSSTTRNFLLMSLMLPLFIIPNFSALPPIYAKDVFSGGPDTLGLLLSAAGVGGIAGGFVSASFRRLEHWGIIQLASLLLTGLSFFAFALSTEFWMALVFMTFAGFFEMIFITANTTLLQLSIPASLRGRVMGIVSLTSVFMPVGALIAGIGADLVGPKTMTIIFSVVIGVIALVVFFASPMIREYRLSEALKDTVLK